MHKKLIRPLSVLTLLFAVLLLCGITARAAGTDIEDWQTVLVNPWNTLPEDHTVSLETVTGHYKVDTRCCDDL